MNIILGFVNIVFDCIKDYFDDIILPVGKRLYYILFVILGFLVFSILSKFLGIPTFVGISESVLALVFTGAMCIIDYVNKNGVNSIKSKFKQIKERSTNK